MFDRVEKSRAVGTAGRGIFDSGNANQGGGTIGDPKIGGFPSVSLCNEAHRSPKEKIRPIFIAIWLDLWTSTCPSCNFETGVMNPLALAL